MKKNTKLTVFTALLITGTLMIAACGSTDTATKAASGAVNPAADASNAGNTATPGMSPVSYSDAGNTITVNSSENVTVVPDIAEVVYAVRTEAKNAADCQQKNAEAVNNVIELLKTLGVSEKSIQTTDYYMYPVYDYSGNTQRITGYEATASLTVSDLPIDNLSDILAKSVESGINNIQSITYLSSKYDEGYTEALKLAVASAKIKAEALAEAGGCTIGKVVNIRENSNYSEARYTDNALASKMRTAETEQLMSDKAVSSVMPGEVDIEVNITVEYSIQ